MLNTFTFGISHLQPSVKNKGSIKCNQAKEDLMHAVFQKVSNTALQLVLLGQGLMNS